MGLRHPVSRRPFEVLNVCKSISLYHTSVHQKIYTDKYVYVYLYMYIYMYIYICSYICKYDFVIYILILGDRCAMVVDR